jgi:hypothetical protein
MKNAGGLLIVLAPIALAGCGGGGDGYYIAPLPKTNTTSNPGGTWTWVGGTNVANSAGVYGTQGVASASNVPSARGGASSWIDASGNLWLFGGVGLNDLWEYTPGTGEWTWAGGSNVTNAIGIYGTKDVPSASNVPSARDGASSSTDSSGNFWLFGGWGLGSSLTSLETSLLNDLWKYNPITQEWTWISGPDGLCTGENCSGDYGTLGLASATNLPGPRSDAASWIDASGNFWLFGGTYINGDYNDLWEYAPSTGEWTWVSGSNVANAAAVYGTKGVASASNVPGARWGASSWIDASGNLWLFGGNVNAGSPPGGSLNDLWEYSPDTREWTWVSGSNVANAAGVYGTQGVASASNVPSARGSASSWIDASGNLWLFGGGGPPQDVGSSAAGYVVLTPYLNDLWVFNPNTTEWTWVSGSSMADAAGVYGTRGVASASNVPSAREAASSWIDASGNLWLFGGSSNAGGQNDLWKFTPAQ